MTTHHPAAVTAACHARDAADLKLLLAALGLLATDPTAPALGDADTDSSGEPSAMPHTPQPQPATGVDAFQAVAVSMHYDGYPTEAISEATGLTAEEITALVADTEAKTAETTQQATAGAAPADIAPTPEESDAMSALLAWAEQHTLAGVRGKAARIRADLADLDQRRSTEQATADTEARIAKLKADLEAAQEDLRKLKAGPRIAAPTTTVVATPIRPAGKRSKEDLARIRTWGREHGHQVADRGLPPKHLIDAYDAAHQPAPLAEAG